METQQKLDMSLDELISWDRRTTAPAGHRRPPHSSFLYRPPPLPRRHAPSFPSSASRLQEPALFPYRRYAKGAATYDPSYSLRPPFFSYKPAPHPFSPAKAPYIPVNRNGSSVAGAYGQTFSAPSRMVSYVDAKEHTLAGVQDRPPSITLSGVKGISETALKQLMRSYGSLKSLVFPDKNTVVIEFDKVIPFKKLKDLDGYELEGSKISVQSVSEPSDASSKRKRVDDTEAPAKRRHAPPFSNLSYIASHHDRSNSSSAAPTSGLPNLRAAPTAKGAGASIVVTNVPSELTAQDVQDAFSVVGTVVKTEVLLNSSGAHTGRVALLFEDAKAASEAVRRFDGGALNSQIIRVFLES